MTTQAKLAAMAKGRKRAATKRKRAAKAAVAAYRSWMRDEAAADYAYRIEPTAANREHLSLVRSAIPPIPTDSQYASSRS